MAPARLDFADFLRDHPEQLRNMRLMPINGALEWMMNEECVKVLAAWVAKHDPSKAAAAEKFSRFAGEVADQMKRRN